MELSFLCRRLSTRSQFLSSFLGSCNLNSGPECGRVLLRNALPISSFATGTDFSLKFSSPRGPFRHVGCHSESGRQDGGLSFDDTGAERSVERGNSVCESPSKKAMDSQADGKLGIVLGIETSCDETGVAIVTTDGRVLGEALASQMSIHSEYGGVFPKIAKMEHEKNIDTVVQDALSMANLSLSDLSAVAVTQGPGLSLCLGVGIRKARKISHDYQIPLINVHHMEAHALVIRMVEKNLDFPFLVLLISGGHNLVLLAHGVGQYTQISTTLDDALGEAYDKTARLLGLPLHEGGGRALEKIAKEGDEYAFDLKVPMKNNPSSNFSYAGLKTSVRYLVEENDPDAEKKPLELASAEERKIRANIAATFQRVAISHLEDKLSKAIEIAKQIQPDVHSMVIAGGVASNDYVRSRLQSCFGMGKTEGDEENVAIDMNDKESKNDSKKKRKKNNKNAKKFSFNLYFPAPHLCTDNGVMVAWAGVENYRLGRFDPPLNKSEADEEWVEIKARWPLGIPLETKENRDGIKSAKKRELFPPLSSLTLAPSRE